LYDGEWIAPECLRAGGHCCTTTELGRGCKTATAGFGIFHVFFIDYERHVQEAASGRISRLFLFLTGAEQRRTQGREWRRENK
jgi:hypothetical protein